MFSYCYRNLKTCYSQNSIFSQQSVYFFRIGQLVYLKIRKWEGKDVPAPDTVYNNITTMSLILYFPKGSEWQVRNGIGCCSVAVWTSCTMVWTTLRVCDLLLITKTLPSLTAPSSIEVCRVVFFVRTNCTLRLKNHKFREWIHLLFIIFRQQKD